MVLFNMNFNPYKNLLVKKLSYPAGYYKHFSALKLDNFSRATGHSPACSMYLPSAAVALSDLPLLRVPHT